jgi:hypothetical protein
LETLRWILLYYVFDVYYVKVLNYTTISTCACLFPATSVQGSTIRQAQFWSLGVGLVNKTSKIMVLPVSTQKDVVVDG